MTGAREGEAAIVLCGGFSRRMGRDKWSLPFGNETFLERTVRIVKEVVDEVWVVAREGQDIGGGMQIARDSAEGLGPLAGLAAGLQAMEAERAFLTSCDVPFLDPRYIRFMLDASRGYTAAVPLVGGFHMTTSAVYAKSLLPVARGLLDAHRLRPLFLVEEANARIVREEEVRTVDPMLASLRNCNTMEDYRRALAEANLPDKPTGSRLKA